MSANPTRFDYIEPATVAENEAKTSYVALSETRCCGDQRPLAVKTQAGTMKKCASCRRFI